VPPASGVRGVQNELTQLQQADLIAIAREYALTEADVVIGADGCPFGLAREANGRIRTAFRARVANRQQAECLATIRPGELRRQPHQVARVGRNVGLAGSGGAAANAEPTGPDAAHIKAQDKVIASGKKLVDQEKFKREEHPFDAYPRLKQQALTNAPPSPADNFRWRYYGLFYVAPAQDSYMCRLRIPNGILKHWQLAGLADLTEQLCGPFCHVTTRANLQVREIPPKNAVALIEGIQDLGLCSRGSGADNIRNVTGTPTAGIDPQELIDTREYAREWHFHILNDRSLYGLPRKFNVAFDGAGKIAVLEDTNDIAFAAVEVKDGFGVEPGVWFRLGIGGITGHKDFAKETGIVVKPADATKVADAIVRAFIDTGDRTNRLKARLKYVIDNIGMEKFLELVEAKLGQTFTRVPADAMAPRPASAAARLAAANPSVPLRASAITR